jgi:hypothetical protein
VYKKKVVTERIQQSVIINPVKKARKPPFPRRPPTPPPAEDSKTATPELDQELEPLPPSSDDDSGLSDVEDTPMTTVDTTPKPLTKTARLRAKPIKTYKINKTIAKSSVSKTVISKAAVMAAKNGALEEILAEAAGRENTAKVVTNKVARKLMVSTTVENTSAEEDVELDSEDKDDILNRPGTVNDMVPNNAAVAVNA